MKKINYAMLLFVVGLMTMSFSEAPEVIVSNNESLELFFEIDLSDLDEDQGWGSWNTTDCFRGLDFRVRNDGYNKYADKYRWSIQFRNRYQENIHFSYKAVAPNQKGEIRASGKTTDRLHVDGNYGTRGSYYLVPSQNSIYVYVNKVRIGPKDYGSDYADCDI